MVQNNVHWPPREAIAGTELVVFEDLRALWVQMSDPSRGAGMSAASEDKCAEAEPYLYVWRRQDWNSKKCCIEVHWQSCMGMVSKCDKVQHVKAQMELCVSSCLSPAMLNAYPPCHFRLPS